MTTAPPITGSAHTWLIVLGLAIGPGVSNGIGRFAYGLLLPAMRSDLGWSYTEAGLINTANAAGYLIGALLALRIIQTVGPQRLFIGGMVLTALALILSGLTRDFWTLSLWRVLAGIGGAPVFIAGGAMASQLFRDDPRGNALAIAVYFGGGGLGLFVSGLAVPILLERAGDTAWPLAWLVLGIIAAVAVLPCALAAQAIGRSPQAPAGACHVPLPARRMAPLLAGYFLFGVGYVVYMTFLVAWMRSEGASTALVTATWSLLGLAVMASPFPWRGVLARSSGGAALALATLGTAAGTLLPIAIAGPAGVLLSAALSGISFFIAPTAVTSFARKNLAEGQWGAAVALFTVLFALGQMIGPVAAGYIADLTDSVTLCLAGAGLILVTGAGLAALQRPLVTPS
jgi:MFS family permease